VEKKYRSTLNDKYASLADLISRDEVQQICGREGDVRVVQSALESNNNAGNARRQSKTMTLTAAIETIRLLDLSCNRKAERLKNMIQQLSSIQQAKTHVLGDDGSQMEECRDMVVPATM